MSFRVINGVIYPLGNYPAVEKKNCSNTDTEEIKGSKSFNDILKSKLEKEKFFSISKHAAERLQNVNFDNQDMKVINEGINKAQEKGAKNCLILYKDVALVTSIENRTVITAVQGERVKDNVFTNVDSVVLLK